MFKPHTDIKMLASLIRTLSWKIKNACSSIMETKLLLLCGENMSSYATMVITLKILRANYTIFTTFQLLIINRHQHPWNYYQMEKKKKKTSWQKKYQKDCCTFSRERYLMFLTIVSAYSTDNDISFRILCTVPSWTLISSAMLQMYTCFSWL